MATYSDIISDGGMDPRAELERPYRDEIERLRWVEQILKLTVIGWREWDWPEGFDRRTAGIIANVVGEQLAALEGK